MATSGQLQTLQNAAAATGNGTPLNTMDKRGYLSVLVSGTFVGTVTFEGTVDGTNWFAVGLKTWADGAAVTTATAAGQFKLPLDLLISKFRARVSAYTSGAITVVAYSLARNVDG